MAKDLKIHEVLDTVRTGLRNNASPPVAIAVMIQHANDSETVVARALSQEDADNLTLLMVAHVAAMVSAGKVTGGWSRIDAMFDAIKAAESDEERRAAAKKRLS